MKSIKMKFMLPIGILFFTFLLIMMFQIYNQKANLNSINEINDKSYVALTKSEQLKLEVVQIQQYLTDVSATGYDDGFEAAETSMQNAVLILDELSTLAPEQSNELNEISSELKLYYDTGVNMAHAYLSGGPTQGNVIMETFDAASLAINDNINKLKEDSHSRIESNISDINESIQKIIMISIIISIVMLLGIVVIWFLIDKTLKPIKRLVTAANQLARGEIQLDVGNSSNDELGLLSKAFGTMVANIKRQAEAAEKIAAGDLSINISPNSEMDLLGNSLVLVVESLNNLARESKKLTESSIKGELGIRGNTEKFSGGYKEIIEGFNNTLDAFVAPINVTAEYVERISKGNIPPKITDTYLGDFNEIKNNLNNCIDVMNSLLDETGKLIQATQAGKLDARADASLFAGDWGTLLKGINQTISSIVGHIDNLPSPVLIIDKEFTLKYINKLGASLTGLPLEQVLGTKCYDCFKTNDCKTENCACAKAMNQNTKIVSETTAHPNGLELEISYTGLPLKDGNQQIIGAVELIVDQTEIVKGQRRTEKQAEYQGKEVAGLIVNLEKLAKGDLTIQTAKNESDEDTRLIAENFEKVNLYLNNCVSTIKTLLDETNMLISAAQDGKLDTRANAAAFTGGWGDLVGGVNQLVEAVVKPINEVTAIMNEISNGNLSVSVTGDYKGEFEVLSQAVNKTAQDLNHVVGEISSVIGQISDGNLDLGEVREYRGDFKNISDSLNNIIISLNEVMGDIGQTAEQVAAGSSQVSDGSQALSQGATEQASSIQELTASITEVAAKTKENAENAGQANNLTLDVKENAEQGNVHMTEMLNAMGEINEASANISRIIKVIDDIAFQTNILALNAAVEAARAGQHGKGFAVVAEEVRNLAARSANAAKETTDLIQGSMQKAERGTGIANETAKALTEIVSGVAKAAELVADIATSSNEQAMGISQINVGVSQVSQVVQTNAATAEESAAASEELSSQAELLKGLVARFKIRKGAMGTAASEIRLLEEKGKSNRKSTPSKPQILLKENEYDKY